MRVCLADADGDQDRHVAAVTCRNAHRPRPPGGPVVFLSALLESHIQVVFRYQLARCAHTREMRHATDRNWPDGIPA
ncbi:hypothetical protein XHV734_2173 [Xanthomonas hortorum pv. vitians]|nr:hypothetical protein XHV734_2173 [Xanthomonas hortorum pv. vitians]